ncbi:uncharacterized protein N7473_012308 [Penicillium subrubescens]|uniref:uncharacterized protein n=1 Tax=Penicillium subrubescens TaxID=1316194 RepID=UPI0025453A9C|nr:uncharacterized protein N7473_012308 [Penicillium subrubescens]KAJ5881255.1 hypothetical protein N7473_012308 [Penicillium subrubescens]
MVELDKFKSRYEAVKAVEQDKDKIIEDLMEEVKRLQDALYHEKDDLENQRKLVQTFKSESKMHQSETEEMKRNQAKFSFVSVLIDGDCMNFNDSFIQDGQRGGHSAARRLIENVDRYIQNLYRNESSNVPYRIRVYANVRGLAKTYRENKTISEEGTLLSFVQGFNMEDVLCDFVDAGDGKECSDVKIRARFEQDIINVHCRHIMFCASADNGYARILGPHRNSNTKSQITLVEGPPFAREIKELVPSFATTSFPEVFRSQKLSRRISFSNAPTTPTGTGTSTPISNYASIVRSTPHSPHNTSPSPSPSPPTPNQKTKLPIHKNALGQRIDRPLHYSTRGKLEALKQHKFCNQFHILGSCSWGEGY